MMEKLEIEKIVALSIRNSWFNPKIYKMKFFDSKIN